MKQTTYKIWYWRIDKDLGVIDQGCRTKEYVRYGNAVNAAKKIFRDTDYRWTVSQSCPWKLPELCTAVFSAKDLPKSADCKNCFHYEACLDADTEEYMLHGEFPEECKHFIDKKYVHIDEAFMFIDKFISYANEALLTKRELIDAINQSLHVDDIVIDEDGNALLQQRERDFKLPKVGIPPLKINMNIDISKELKMLGLDKENGDD